LDKNMSYTCEKGGAVMTATSRRSRNYKEKNSMFAFGHFALPIAALIAVGLLFVGIKLFFLTSSDSQPEVEISVIEPDPQPNGMDGEFAETSPEPDIYAVSQESVPEVSQIVVVTPPEPIVGPIGTKDNAASATRQQPTNTGNAARPAKRPQPARNPQRPATQGASGTGWAVQVGAFSKAEGANTVLDQVKKQGYSASISKTETSGSTFHRVRVAAGKSREEAQRLAVELEKKGYPVLVVPAR
jgi:cell division septation protein DedD